MKAERTGLVQWRVSEFDELPEVGIAEKNVACH